MNDKADCMDTIKSCGTSITAVNGYGVVAYRLLSLTVENDASGPNVPEFDALDALETRLREDGRLMFIDRSKLLLWLFEPGTDAPVIDLASLQSPHVKGLSINSPSHGEFKAADLTKPVSRASNFSVANSLASPITNARGNQAANLRAVQANSQAAATSPNVSEPKQNDPHGVYEIFLSAVIASISHRLSRFHQMIPMNYRTFAAFSIPEADSSDDTDLITSRCDLVALNVHLSTAGTLVISTSVTRKPLYQLGSIANSANAIDTVQDELVRVSPSGQVARFLGLETPATSNERNGAFPSKRLRLGHQWKSKVLRWLRSKGVILAPSDGDVSWSRIQLSRGSPSDRTDTQGIPGLARLECLWPSNLCLLEYFEGEEKNWTGITSASSLSEAKNKDNELDWFENPYNAGFEDPLELAQRWWQGKPQRDRDVESRRKAQQAQHEPGPGATEPVSAYPSSPLYSRGSAYGDLQAASGVYPTPPDGVLPHIAGASATVNVDGAIAQSTTAPGSGNLGPVDNNGNAPAAATPKEPQEHAREAEAQLLPQSTEPESNNDDLFGEMDEEEDMFGGNNITDADFNFFDDGDGGNFGDLMDIEPAQPAEENFTSMDAKPEENVQAADIGVMEMKTEQHHDNIEQISQAEKHETPVAPSEEHDMEAEDVKDESPAIPIDPEVPPTERIPVPVREIPTTPLSPSRVNERLFPSPHSHPEGDALQSNTRLMPTKKRGREFDPVSFSRKMSVVDEKYSTHGRFSISTIKSKTDSEDISSSPKDQRSESAPQIRLPTSQSIALRLGNTEKLAGHAWNTTGRAGNIDSPADDSETDSLSDITESSSSFEEASQNQEPTRPPTFAPGHKRKWVSSAVDSPVVNSPSVAHGESTMSEIADDTSMDVNLVGISSFEPSPHDWSLQEVPVPAINSGHPSRPSGLVRMDSSSMSSAASTPSSDSRPESSHDALSSKPQLGMDFITITQILTQQIIFSSLDMLGESTGQAQLEYGSSPRAAGLNDPYSRVNAAVKGIFPKAVDCDISKYSSILDFVPEPPSSAKAQPRPVPRRTATSQPDGQGNTFLNMATPHVRIRRSDDFWDVLPPALAFWETLGLAPSSGPKNVVAFCVYPQSEQLKDPVVGFIDNLSMAYESCKLGHHLRGISSEYAEYVPPDSSIATGLAPVALHDFTIQGAYRAYSDTCLRLGKALGEVELMTGLEAVVIYMVNPFSDHQALWHLCMAFVAMFKAYAYAIRGKQDMPDIVLQLVPIKYVASFDVPVILEADDLIALAREVYDRCPPNLSKNNAALKIYQGPSIHLEETLPKAIPFRIAADPSLDLMHENSYLHVGYALNFDGSWVTVGWTDTPGKHQETASYSLSRRTFAELAREVWQASLEIMQSRRVTWRLCIARAGVMEREELDAWTALANTPCQIGVGTALVSVDTSPQFALKQAPTPLTTLPPHQSSNQGASTPVSTPQPGVSPDQHGMTPAATPSDTTTQDLSTDPDARLVDITDDFYAVILNHRLNNSNSSVEYRPAIVSGYLLKRGADTPHPANPDSPRGPVAVGYNLLWIGAAGCPGTRPSPSVSGDGPLPSPGGVGMGVGVGSVNPFAGQAARNTGEIVLREFLSMYRGLGLLAKLRGMRGAKGGAVPWHVVVAKRGVEALERVFR